MPTLSSNGTQTAVITKAISPYCVQTFVPYKDEQQRKTYHQLYYEKHKEQEKADRRKYYWDNIERLREQRKKEWAENKNGIRDRHREYRQKHWKHLLECNNKSRKKYRETNAEEIIQRTRRHMVERKYQLCDILGSRVCIRCGYSDIRALQFDHINGKGHKTNMEVLKRKVMSYYELKYYIDHQDEARKTFQVLCANCNWVKRWEQFECATNIHKLERLDHTNS